MNSAEGTVISRGAGHAGRQAIIDPAGVTSYANLDAASRRVAAALLAGRSDLQEERITFLQQAGADWVALQWGIWRAGGIAVPLAVSHPGPELDRIIADASPVAIIADTTCTDRIEPVAARRGIPIEATSDILRGRDSGTAPLPDIALDRRAMMLYTSGTTGQPKGVVTTHSNISAQIATLVEAWGWVPDDRILHVLPLHHVHGIINALSCALWVGACCEFLPRFEPATTWDRLASGEITVFMAVPTIYGRLIAAWESADAATRRAWSDGARRLRLMVSGSAALPVRTHQRWREITGHVLLERYGMTEIGMALSNPLLGERRAGTVGQPLPGVELRVVDDAGVTTAAGTAGEIEVRGPQVFLEYWRAEAETRSAFRDTWFRTGDQAVIEDGYYRILGRRSSDILKSGGYKLSALEIEDVLREHEQLVDCAVVGLPDDDLGERVAVAVVARSGGLDADTLLAWARERLAPYKVPRDVAFIDALPCNAMGKVTKQAIRELFRSTRSRSG